MRRRYVVHFGPRFSDAIVASSARSAARLQVDRWFHGRTAVGVTMVVVDATGEVVPEDLWK